MTREEAEKIKRTVDCGYHERDDYPPFAIDSMADRNRYREYVFKIIDEHISDEKPKPKKRVR